MTEPRFRGRRTIYKGITMRSRLEASYAALMDRAHVTWQYEPQCFADERGQYLPDFRVILAASQVIYVDVKPFAAGALGPAGVHPAGSPADDWRQACLECRMNVILSSEPTAWLAVWCPSPWGLEHHLHFVEQRLPNATDDDYHRAWKFEPSLARRPRPVTAIRYVPRRPGTD